MARPKKEVTETKEVKTPKTSAYTLTLTLAGTVHKGTGNTALEALKAIKPPVKIFTKGDVALSHAGKSMMQTWQPIKVKRLFQPLAQGIMAKQLEYLLR
jgi:hypothetical protein